MCPTFLVTGDEIMSTRGRANAIRAALEHRCSDGKDPLTSVEMETALGNCLSCKACTTECPSNVDLALLKTELLHARIQQGGISLRDRLFSSLDLLAKIGCTIPNLANAALSSLFLRSALTKTLGIAWQRPLPRYARQRFDTWFRKSLPDQSASRGQVILWDDTFTRYYEPHIGIAAVKLLRTAGFEVLLPTHRKCCGRPAFSLGNLEKAQKLGQYNIALLERTNPDAPILFLEPSCYSMFVEDYEELNLKGAESMARRCMLFDRFIEQLLTTDPNALKFKTKPAKLVIHPHCHVKALMNPDFMISLAEKLPGRNVSLLETGCCGMAGSFGMLESKYELSLKVAEPLAQQVRRQPFGTLVIASGASCRQQIEHLAPVKPRHMAEVLADAIA
jgi:Fe-S oxidoreductase